METSTTMACYMRQFVLTVCGQYTTWWVVGMRIIPVLRDLISLVLPVWPSCSSMLHAGLATRLSRLLVWQAARPSTILQCPVHSLTQYCVSEKADRDWDHRQAP